MDCLIAPYTATLTAAKCVGARYLAAGSQPKSAGLPSPYPVLAHVCSNNKANSPRLMTTGAAGGALRGICATERGKGGNGREWGVF